MILGLMGCSVIVVFAVAGFMSSPGTLAAAAFLITCGLLGFTILGAVGERNSVGNCGWAQDSSESGT